LDCEQSQRLGHIVGPFHEVFGVPFAARYREEVTPIHVDGAGQALDRINDGMDDLRPERHRLPFTECSCSSSSQGIGRLRQV